MKLGRYQIKLEKKSGFTGWQAAVISIVAILFALFLVGFIFLQAGVDPALGYQEIFSYAFLNPFGLPLTLNRAVFLLFCSFAFIVPIRAGLWNIGMAGQAYAGALGAFAVALALGAKGSQTPSLPGGALVGLMILGAMLGGMAVGAIPGILKGKFNTNEIVTTMMINFIMFWLVAYMIKEGGPFMGSGGEGEGFKLTESVRPPLFKDTPFTLWVSLALAALLYILFARTKIGYQIRAFGSSPAAARYAGISPVKISLLVFVAGGLLAGLAGYHYFAAVPGLYKIPKNYGDFGDLAFYGIICGLISQGNPLASIPLALLFGGLTNGGRFVQGKLQLGFGIDYALLGVVMIILVAFQFFFRYRVILKKAEKEN
ncbi:MAG: ABC transporter permease [Chloroflexi bacterium]|nr:ABC transporter permease [Anaerolineales bacterium]RIK47156.1 MAG: ABC transporter permease [Chloroflexota bacterium]